MRRDSLLLFPYENPLSERFGRGFFKEIPKSPGVYFFRGANGDILYVGKAKDLRARLNSYRRAKPGQVSRKVLRMMKMTRSIAFELCDSDTHAQLVENRLLRTQQPPFNVVNTHPELYYFIGYQIIKKKSEKLHPERIFERSLARSSRRRDHATLRIFMTTNSESAGKLFGVFKSRRVTRESFAALLRLISAVNAERSGFYFPMTLVRPRPPSEFTMNVPRQLVPQLSAFLNGRSRVFLDHLVELLLGNLYIPKFIHHVISEDLQTLSDFYQLGPKRISLIKKTHGIKRRVVRQEEIDDLLVLMRQAQTTDSKD